MKYKSSMSIRISLLKKSKAVVSKWLENNYEGEYNLFYSIGTQQNSYKDQFLKIELDCPKRRFGHYATELRKELLLTDYAYADLALKIFQL